jgi:manganese/iron transport system ATP-binding protein
MLARLRIAERATGPEGTFGPSGGPCGPIRGLAWQSVAHTIALVDTRSHMTAQPPTTDAPHAHPGRAPHTHDGPLDASHAHAHADVWLSDVSAGYGDRTALEHVTVAVEPGSLLAVVGPNGAGKSTLLKLMAGLLQPWSGRIEILGQPSGREARRVAYVPQAELVDWAFPVTVEDVVMMGRFPRLGPIRRPGTDDRRAVREALGMVGMDGHLRTQIGRLSGGQRRRVFLARALAAEPDLFLLDEPVTGIDPGTQELLMDILEAQAARGKTVVATTHDLACAAQRFQQVLAVNRTVVAYGPSDIVLDTDVLAAAYGGHLLMLEGRTMLLDDAHHHDDAAPGERHFHEHGR